MSQAQAARLQQMVKLIHVPVPHHWDKYHTDKVLA
jgi:hypothetical protein